MNAILPIANAGEILAPKSVAVIGASEDLTKFGGRIYKNLVHHGFKGQIYPINPKRESLLGIKCYPAIGATPTPPDMAVMAVPRVSPGPVCRGLVTVPPTISVASPSVTTK